MTKLIASFFLIFIVSACGVPTDNPVVNNPGVDNPVTDGTTKVVKKPADDTTTTTDKPFTGASMAMTLTGAYASGITGLSFAFWQFDKKIYTGFLPIGQVQEVPLSPGHYYIRTLSYYVDGCNGMLEFSVVKDQKTVLNQPVACLGKGAYSLTRTVSLSPTDVTQETLTPDVNLQLIKLNITHDALVDLHLNVVMISTVKSSTAVSVSNCTIASADGIVRDADTRQANPDYIIMGGTLVSPAPSGDFAVKCTISAPVGQGEYIVLSPYTISIFENQYFGIGIWFDDVDQPSITKTITF